MPVRVASARGNIVLESAAQSCFFGCHFQPWLMPGVSVVVTASPCGHRTVNLVLTESVAFRPIPCQALRVPASNISSVLEMGRV